jgi:hypothetical protein
MAKVQLLVDVDALTAALGSAQLTDEASFSILAAVGLSTPPSSPGDCKAVAAEARGDSAEPLQDGWLWRSC